MQERMRKRKWGVFNHYICTPGRDKYYNGTDLSDWNKTIESFDAEKLAYTLHKMGAGYYFLTLVHGNQYMTAPNSAFDRMFGTKPGEACPSRDLVLDIYNALQKYDIDLCLYFNCLSPFNTGFKRELREHIGITEEKFVDQENVLVKYDAKNFVSEWSQVLKEFAVRYGDKVKMWWLDSCYTYSGYTDDLLKFYHDAIKARNPNALIGFNQAELIINPEGDLKKTCEYESLTCGENNFFNYIPKGGTVDGALSHLLIPLGVEREFCGRWCSPETEYSNEFIRSYIDKVNAVGGIVTVDIFVNPDGSFTEKQIEVLSANNS